MANPNFTDFEYFISYRVSGSGEGGWVETNQPATVHPFVISGLASGTTYEFRVRKRRKSNGFSKYSSSLTATLSADVATGVENVVIAANGTFTADTLIGSVSGSRNNDEIQITDGSYAGNWEYSTIEYTDTSGVLRKYALVNAQNLYNTNDAAWPAGYSADAAKFSYTGSATKDFSIAALFSIPVTFTLVYKGQQQKTLLLRFPAIAQR